MKNKSLTILITILTIIVLIVVLSSTVFCLKSVEINFMSNTINLTNKEEEIIESGDFKLSQSIFFINKSKYVNKLENQNPYLKVVNIETKFPNTLVINAIERSELFVIKGYENDTFKSYLVVDSELKVLNKLTSYTNTYENAILLESDEKVVNTDAGYFVTTNNSQLIKQLANELLCYNQNTNLLKANFENIALNYESNGSCYIKMRSGTEIVIKQADLRLQEKFTLALSVYDELTDKTSGRLTVDINTSDKVFCTYSS